MSSSRDFEDLEQTLLKPDQDVYEQSIKDKQSRRMYVSNFLESREQSQASAMGGQMFSSKKLDMKEEEKGG